MAEVSLRKATEEDSELAYQTKKAAFRGYVEEIEGWDEAEQRRLHAQRFQSQTFFVLQASGLEVGILALARASDEIKLNQLFILPEHQGKGYGSACMHRLIAEAETAKMPIRLKVLKVNLRALTFYQRLGFTDGGETDMHVLLERR
jgi:GNAT superfamily N-acetyltransferase